jgi:asparagine synthase (glutamine-hydrolysing)
MCGIAGIFTRAAVSLQESAARMVEQIRHRGPDGEGIWTDGEAGVALGHRRLAVLDLSEAGHQPMPSASGRWMVVLNGEIYNHLEIRREIEDGGSHSRWRGHSDTETVIEAIHTWGFREALSRLVGMFAIAAWDRQDRRLWLARDRMGEKPLYYGWVRGSFVFSSELRAIRAFAGGAGLSVSPTSLSLLTSLNYIPGPHSIYREIGKLLPGTLLRLAVPDDSSVRPEAYWELPAPSIDGEPSLDMRSHVAMVNTALRQAVRSQMLADVPLGALLSGGIDSSLVVAMMQAESASPIKTFTIGFDDLSSDESFHARRVAQFLGTDHREMVVTPQVALDQIPRLPSLLDEPMGDSSQIPTMCVMGLARQHVTVALSGDGADELFGGYGRYRSIPRGWGLVRRVPHFARAGAAKIVEQGLLDHLASLGGERGRASLRRARYYLPRMARANAANDLYVSSLMQWVGCEIVLNQRQSSGADVAAVLDRVTSRSLVPFMMEADALTYLPDDVLVKVDRAAMTYSLETRAPFLDKRVVELSSRIPLASKLERGRGKAVLHECLAKYLPRELFERPKQGFSVPLDGWLRGPLREWAESLLDPRQLKADGYLRHEPIRSVWARHQSGHVNAGHQLWSVLMFQAWLENARKTDEMQIPSCTSAVVA